MDRPRREAQSDFVDGDVDRHVPQEDAIRVEANAGYDAVGQRRPAVSPVMVEEKKQRDPDGVGKDPLGGDCEDGLRGIVEEEQRGDDDKKPEPAEILEAVEGVGERVVEDGKEYAVEDAVDAGVGGVEGGEAVGGEDEFEGDYDRRERGHAQEEVTGGCMDAAGDGEEQGEEEVGVLFDGERPHLSEGTDVVLDVEEIAAEIVERGVVAEDQIEQEDIILGPDFQGSADEEAGAVGVATEGPLFDEEAADEEAAEDEEDVDADPAGVPGAKGEDGEREDGAGGVEVDDEEDADAAQEVELNLTTFGERGTRVDGHQGSLALAGHACARM